MTRRDTRWLVVVSAWFFLDRLTKLLVRHSSDRDLAPLLSLTPIENRGVAFSLPLPAMIAFVLIGLVLAVVLAQTVRRFLAGQVWWSWGLLFGGGFSNWLDRLQTGAVTDFIRFWWLPIFNLADLAVIAGLLFLLFPRLTGKPGGA